MDSTTQRVSNNRATSSRQNLRDVQPGSTRVVQPGSTRGEARKIMSPLKGVEMLKFSSRESNIQRVLKQYRNYAVATHGAVGGLVETGALPPLPGLPDENSDVLQGLSAAQRNTVISKLLEDRVKQHRQREDALPKMFAEMMMFTPPEGLHVMEERAEYAAINAARDPIGMRRLLLDTFTSPGVTDNVAKRKTIVERHYSMCYQRHGEDEKSFYDRLKLAWHSLDRLMRYHRKTKQDIT